MNHGKRRMLSLHKAQRQHSGESLKTKRMTLGARRFRQRQKRQALQLVVIPKKKRFPHRFPERRNDGCGNEIRQALNGTDNRLRAGSLIALRQFRRYIGRATLHLIGHGRHRGHFACTRRNRKRRRNEADDHQDRENVTKQRTDRQNEKLISFENALRLERSASCCQQVWVRGFIAL